MNLSKTSLICFVALTISASSVLSANDAFKKKALELYPQADTNGDGVLSDQEEAAFSRQALKRYPQADRDGDGVLPYHEIRQARYSNASLMPEGLDQLLKPEEIADLVAYLKSSKPPNGTLEASK